MQEELSKNNLNYDDIKNSKIDDYILKNEKEVNEFLSAGNHLAIVNNKFLRTFINNSKINPINFTLSYQTINLALNSIKKVPFKTNNNIICIQNTNGTPNVDTQGNIKKKNLIYISFNLKHLIRYHYFKRELTEYSNSSPSNNFRIAYLINNQVINKFKEIYQLQRIFNDFDKHKLLDGFSYKNSDANYEKLNEFLNNNNNEYVKYLQKSELPKQIKFNENEIVFIPKCFNNKPNLVYIDNFEIIDQEYHSFLLKMFGPNLFMYQVNYASLEKMKEKILLIIDYNKTYIYEIVSLNNQGGNVEYLLEIINTNNDIYLYKNRNLINKSILDFISKNDITKTIHSGNQIIIQNNISIKFHPINIQSIPNNHAHNNLHMNNINAVQQNPGTVVIAHNQNNVLQRPVMANTNLSKSINLENANNFGNNEIKDISIEVNRYYLIDNGLLGLISSIDLNTFLNLNQGQILNVDHFANQINESKYRIKTMNIQFENKTVIYPYNFNIIDNTHLALIGYSSF